MRPPTSSDSVLLDPQKPRAANASARDLMTAVGEVHEALVVVQDVFMRVIEQWIRKRWRQSAPASIAEDRTDNNHPLSALKLHRLAGVGRLVLVVDSDYAL